MFFQFLVIKALDPDWIRIRIRIGLQPQPLDPGSVKNEYGSETLPIMTDLLIYWRHSETPRHIL